MPYDQAEKLQLQFRKQNEQHTSGKERQQQTVGKRQRLGSVGP
jgi:hypothetical protein